MNQANASNKEFEQTDQIRDEFDLIQQLSHDFSSYRKQTLVPNGDDAAVYLPEKNHGQVVCVDMLVEDIHFKRTTMSPFHIGYKALAVNLSDIAAMGGEPHSFLVSIAVPPSWSVSALKELYQGMKVLADQYQIDLLGGDTVSAPDKLVINVTALGQVDERVRLLRSQAKSGDVVFVTGTLGGSSAGLDILLRDHDQASNSDPSLQTNEQERTYRQELISAHQLPSPHVEQGALLAYYARNTNVALNDVSDGLASELTEIATASQVDLVIDQQKLPILEALKWWAPLAGKSPYEYALYGGEDFILVGTVPKQLKQDVTEAFAQKNLFLAFIGHAEEGAGNVWLLDAAKDHRIRVDKKGYNHFSSQ